MRRYIAFSFLIVLGTTVFATPFTIFDILDTNKLGVNPHTHEFNFARLVYKGKNPGYIKNWNTDYPQMDIHLTEIIGRTSKIDIGLPMLVDPSSPTLFEYPLIYTVEPEQIDFRKSDVENIRQYLDRGGLWFADDFHGDEEFDCFLIELRKVLPDAELIELSVDHPLFHSFYDISKIIQVTNDGIAKCLNECAQWENGPSGQIPKVFAVLNSEKRIQVIMAWNTDLGDGLEWADDPYYPREYASYAFKFLTNVVVYSMTH